MAEAFDIDGFRGYIAEEVARAFGLLHDRAPALRRAIENGVRFIKIDASARELVFDTRALCLGLVLAGDRDEGAIRYGNSAVWAFDWLSERLGKDAVSILREQPPTPDAALNAARIDEYRVVLSVSVTDLVRVATSIAQQMMGSSDFETRHMFGAMLVKGTIADQVNQIFRSTMSAADLEALKFFFIDRIMQAPLPAKPPRRGGACSFCRAREATESCPSAPIRSRWPAIRSRPRATPGHWPG